MGEMGPGVHGPGQVASMGFLCLLRVVRGPHIRVDIALGTRQDRGTYPPGRGTGGIAILVPTPLQSTTERLPLAPT